MGFHNFFLHSMHGVHVFCIFMQFENSGDSGVEDSVASSSTPSNGSTPRTHTHRIGSNREVVSLLLKMDSTLNTLVDITKKLTAEGGVKKEDDPKYTVSIL